MSFEHVLWRPMHYSIGVEIGSDFADKPVDDPLHWQHNNVGFWSRGEAKLLKQIAVQFLGKWLDIGAHTGWTAAQITGGWSYLDIESGKCRLTAIEPMFSLPLFYMRFVENLSRETLDDEATPFERGGIMPWSGRSDWYFECWDSDGGRKFIGACIDGDHDDPHPLRDAKNCYERLEDRGVIVLHDFRGPGPWNAGKFLADQGMQYKIYGSVHMVGVFWRGDFTPPPEIHEGSINWTRHYGQPEWAK